MARDAPGDLAQAEAAIDRLAGVPTDPRFVLYEITLLRLRALLARAQCQGEVAACCGGWILITWCLARSVVAAFGLACMRFVDARCEGLAGVT